MFEIHQLRGVTVARDEAHHAHAAFEQSGLDGIEPADRCPVRRLADLVAGRGFERGHIGIARRRGHQQRVIRLQYIAEEAARLRCALESVVRLIHDATDAQALFAGKGDHRIDREA